MNIFCKWFDKWITTSISEENLGKLKVEQESVFLKITTNFIVEADVGTFGRLWVMGARRERHNKCFPSSHKSPLLSTSSQTDTYIDTHTYRYTDSTHWRRTINISHPVINHHCCQHRHRQTRIQTHRHQT